VFAPKATGEDLTLPGWLPHRVSKRKEEKKKAGAPVHPLSPSPPPRSCQKGGEGVGPSPFACHVASVQKEETKKAGAPLRPLSFSSWSFPCSALLSLGTGANVGVNWEGNGRGRNVVVGREE